MMRIPEWRSPQTGSTLIERLMVAALLPVSLGIYAAVYYGARALGLVWL
ncbi:hypothetical protein QH494_06075 [Sphingomonas sp. AR_OL41]|nr:hypothetical protein [Sphingomonas sp. AR_OL41]MDH7971745.1 hypothetical protein [Sphingomonas sp. AR_OL41]